MGDFDKCFDFTVGVEGGYSNNLHDKGGPTKYGITLPVLSAWRGGIELDAEDVECMDLAEAKDIYKHNYWTPIHGDELPQGIDLCTFDAAINSGVSNAIRWLQAVIKVKVDGLLGPKTIIAAQTCEPGEVINDLLNLREAYLRSLPDWKYFGKGWKHRIDNLRCAAL
jgi:lysozyme family protein